MTTLERFWNAIDARQPSLASELLVQLQAEAATIERSRLINLVATTMRATTRRFPMATIELREAAAALLDAFARDGHA